MKSSTATRATRPRTNSTADDRASLIELKKAGHWRALWNTFDESVNLMAAGEVVIQSMWSPAVTAVKSQGVKCVYQPLKEGYRGWGNGLALMAHLDGIKLDAAYEYLNWYNSGWVGGFIAKQGYYSANVRDGDGGPHRERARLLLRRQAGDRRHHVADRREDQLGRRSPRRRLLRGALLQGRRSGTTSWTRPSSCSPSGTSSTPPEPREDKDKGSGGRRRSPHARSRRGRVMHQGKT